jgi:predicted O-linked N-acetylglucosamine transferase (SPINDLY family)
VASYLLGLTLSRMGRLDEAEFHLRTPAELPGAQRDCQCEYGRVLCDLGKFTAGVEFLRRATQTDLTSAYAWESLAKGLHQAGLYADAVNAGEEAVRCAARSKSPYGGAGVMKTVGISWAAMADASEAVKWHARAMQEAPGDVMISAAWSYLLNYLDVSPNDATTALSRITECMHQRGGITPFRAPSNFERGVRPLRVGLLTPDLRDHPVSRFMLPLLANTEASRCRYSVYYTHPARDLVSKRCSRYVERWHQVAHLDDEAVARLIRADEPDVLIDLAGWTRPELDLAAFIDLCRDNGLYFIARPGPFVMAEMKNEGLPHWLYTKYPEIIPVGWDGQPATTRTVDVLAPMSE